MAMAGQSALCDAHVRRSTSFVVSFNQRAQNTHFNFQLHFRSPDFVQVYLYSCRRSQSRSRSLSSSLSLAIDDFVVHFFSHRLLSLFIWQVLRSQLSILSLFVLCSSGEIRWRDKFPEIIDYGRSSVDICIILLNIICISLLSLARLYYICLLTRYTYMISCRKYYYYDCLG